MGNYGAPTSHNNGNDIAHIDAWEHMTGAMIPDIGPGDELDLYNDPNDTPQRGSAREYFAGVTVHGDGTDEFSTQKLVIERKAVYPVRQGIAAGMPEDNGIRGGTLRNRLDLEHEAFGVDATTGEDRFGNRIYALTTVSNGPQQSAVIQHVMQENAESFSVHDAQTEPWAYDTAATLPYVQPLNVRENPVHISPEYEQLL